MSQISEILTKLAHLNLDGQIEDIQPSVKGVGASCDVFIGYYRARDKKVAVKKLRIFLSKEEQVLKVRAPLMSDPKRYFIL